MTAAVGGAVIVRFDEKGFADARDGGCFLSCLLAGGDLLAGGGCFLLAGGGGVGASSVSSSEESPSEDSAS